MNQKLNRRIVLTGAAAATAVLAAPFATRGALAQSGSLEGKELRVLTWSDATGQAAVRNILEPFAVKTGAKIVPDLTGTTSDMIAKIKASAASPQYDLVILSGFGANTLAEAGLLDTPDQAMLPNLADVPDTYKTGAGGQGIGYFLWSDGLLYNTVAYTAPPKSYGILWDETNSGKIFVPAAKNLAAMELVIVASKLAGGDAMVDPEPGFKRLAELKDKVLAIEPNINQMADLFRSNSLNAGGPYSPLVVPEFIKDPTYNLSGAYDLEEGFFVDLQYMAVPKGHPGDAGAIHALIDFALSPEAQGKMAEEVWYGPINGKAILSDVAKSNPNVPSPGVVANRAIRLDSAFLSRVQEDWIRRYTAAVGG